MLIQGLFKALGKSVQEGTEVSKKLFPTIICLVIFIKILQEFDLIKYLALPLEPIMGLMGLPPELGIVWAAAMVVNIYSALAILPSLMLSMPALTVEQVTILGLLILIAHSLILETRIVGQCGVSMRFQLFLRFFVAISTGIGVHFVCSHLSFWQEEARILLVQEEVTTLAEWALGELRNLVQIFIMICLVMLLNRSLNYFKISYYFGKLLTPVLRLLGVSSQTTNVMLVGIFMGIIYGSGIIIKNAQEGRISACDNFAVISFMSLSHALIEDTVLLMLIDASLWGLLGIRLFVALLVGVIINFAYLKRSNECIGH